MFRSFDHHQGVFSSLLKSLLLRTLLILLYQNWRCGQAQSGVLQVMFNTHNTHAAISPVLI